MTHYGKLGRCTLLLHKLLLSYSLISNKAYYFLKLPRRTYATPLNIRRKYSLNYNDIDQAIQFIVKANHIQYATWAIRRLPPLGANGHWGRERLGCQVNRSTDATVEELIFHQLIYQVVRLGHKTVKTLLKFNSGVSGLNI